MLSPTRRARARRLRAGRVLSALPVLFLLLDGGQKLLNLTPVLAAFARLGLPEDLAVGIGLLELGCLAFYLFPGTHALGAILLTGYLGAASVTHVRVGDPFFTHVLFPIYVAALLWGGLLLRDDRLRAALAP